MQQSHVDRGLERADGGEAGDSPRPAHQEVKRKISEPVLAKQDKGHRRMPDNN